jgi:hypothetical protein
VLAPYRMTNITFSYGTRLLYEAAHLNKMRQTVCEIGHSMTSTVHIHSIWYDKQVHSTPNGFKYATNQKLTCHAHYVLLLFLLYP